MIHRLAAGRLVQFVWPAPVCRAVLARGCRAGELFSSTTGPAGGAVTTAAASFSPLQVSNRKTRVEKLQSAPLIG